MVGDESFPRSSRRPRQRIRNVESRNCSGVSLIKLVFAIDDESK